MPSTVETELPRAILDPTRKYGPLAELEQFVSALAANDFSRRATMFRPTFVRFEQDAAGHSVTHELCDHHPRHVVGTPAYTIKEDMRMGSKTTHVLPKNGQWAVKREGSANRSVVVYPARKEAMEAARQIVQRAHSGQLVVHGIDGSIRVRESHGLPAVRTAPRKSKLGSKAIEKAVYKPLFRAIVFAACDLGFVARCALEVDDAIVLRLDKIGRIIGQCAYGIHDISSVGLTTGTNRPRFNMPFELGLYLGCQRFGSGAQRRKACLIVDSDPCRYRASISDISGQDIHSHGETRSGPLHAVHRPASFVGRLSTPKTLT